MSGHSKWSTIKHKKAQEDAKKGKTFSKLSRFITLAVKAGGADPGANFELKLAIEKAKAANMPSQNIRKAIQKGMGNKEADNLVEVVYEVHGPEGVTLIIEGVTDNKNRTLSEVKGVVQKHGFRLGEEGSASWMFKKLGILRVLLERVKKTLLSPDEIELKAIDLGVQDIKQSQRELLLLVHPRELMRVKSALEENNIPINSARIEFVASNPLVIEPGLQEKVSNLYEELLDNEDVIAAYSNLVS